PEQVVVGPAGCGHEGAVGIGDASLLGLGADAAVDELGVDALGGVTGSAVFAGAVGDDEGPDDDVSGLDRGHGRTDLFDEADVLVAHQQVVDGLDSAVGPQIGPADAGRRQPHHRVGGFDDPRVLSFGHVDLARGVHDHGTHDVSFGRLVRCLIDPTTHRRAGGAPVGGGTAR